MNSNGKNNLNHLKVDKKKKSHCALTQIDLSVNQQ